MITGFAHVCFIVADLKASQEFYCSKLGLKPAFDFLNDRGEKTGMYIHVSGRNFIEIFLGKPAKPAKEASYQHICLEVDDVAKTVGELRQKGLSVTDAKMGSDQSWQAWLNDPDGNPIELHGYTPASWQGPWVK